MKVVIDRNGLQAAVHLGQHPSQHSQAAAVDPRHPQAVAAVGKRLATFLSIIEDLGCDIAFTSEGADAITDELLADCAILVITTRMAHLPTHTDAELGSIMNFVQRGGSLLVMSNHPFLGEPNPIPDVRVAALFDVVLCGPLYRKRTLFSRYTRIRTRDFRTHEITEGLKGPIVFFNGGRISAHAGDIFVMLPAVKKEPNAFAVAVDKPQGGGGRVVITADSGFIGDDTTEYPGQGLIHQGDNLMFIRQVLSWLLRQ
jgi:hypothetical protein